MTAHSLNIEPDEQIRQTIRRARAEREAEERRRVLKLVAPSALPKADELNRLAKAERKMADPKRRQDGEKERDRSNISRGKIPAMCIAHPHIIAKRLIDSIEQSVLIHRVCRKRSR